MSEKSIYNKRNIVTLRRLVHNVILSTIITSLMLYFNISLAQNNNASSPNIETTQVCELPEQELDEMLDNTRSSAYSSLCGTVSWIDSLFGDKYKFNDKDFRSKLVLGYEYDEIDGFDPKLRVRIKSKLPNVSSKLNAFIGRVEEEDYVSDTQADRDSFSATGLRSFDDAEADWLVGIGYQNPFNIDNGFHFSVGAKISSGLNPYVKLRHRHLFKTRKPHYWQSTQTIFWRKEDGYGSNSNLNYTFIKSQKNIYQWGGSLKYTQEFGEWEWATSTTWHHSITDKKGVSSRAYIRGIIDYPVHIPEYGVTFTYRQPVFRPWFFIETGIDFRWVKTSPHVDYRDSTRLSFQVEMLLGDYNKKRQYK